MNILIVTPGEAAIQLSLCVGAAAAECVLSGEMVVADGSVTITLRDPQGGLLLQQSVTGRQALDGLPSALTWLSERHLRVDAVVHLRAMHQTEHTTVRLNEATLDAMRPFPGSLGLLEAYAHVLNWRADCPQALFMTHRPTTPAWVADTVHSSGVLNPPASCPKKVRVRCESCHATES